MAAEFSNNITGWADAMEQAGFSDQALQLRQDNGDKVQILERIKQAGLPVMPSKLVTLEQFLQDPQNHLSDFQFPLYWASLMPHDPSARKFTEVGINAELLIEFAKRNASLAGAFDIHINQYENNIFGGQAISNNQAVLIEMGRAKQTDVVHGRVDPSQVFQAIKRLTVPSFHYSTEDPSIRAVFWKVLQFLKLPPETDQRQTDVHFRQGYFEFAVTEAPNRPSYGVTFFDYKTGPSFTDLQI